MMSYSFPMYCNINLSRYCKIKYNMTNGSMLAVFKMKSTNMLARVEIRRVSKKIAGLATGVWCMTLAHASEAHDDIRPPSATLGLIHHDLSNGGPSSPLNEFQLMLHCYLFPTEDWVAVMTLLWRAYRTSGQRPPHTVDNRTEWSQCIDNENLKRESWLNHYLGGPKSNTLKGYSKHFNLD